MRGIILFVDIYFDTYLVCIHKYMSIHTNTLKPTHIHTEPFSPSLGPPHTPCPHIHIHRHRHIHTYRHTHTHIHIHTHTQHRHIHTITHT
jgi:hypothetical protein